MSLDEKQIIETAKKIKNGILPKEALKELLGGERLDDIFDSKTQQAIFDNIINNGKLHNMTPNGNGLGILDGLLNNQVSSNLSDFYMIKPDYILQLPLEQQRNMANSISGGRRDLSLALQNLWSKGIRTEACTTKSSDNIPMLQLNIKESEIEKQDMVQQLYEQSDINGNAFYDYQTKDFHINLSGNNLYDYLQDGNIPLSQNEKANIFEDSIRDSLQFAEEMYTSYSQNGMDTTELGRVILSEIKSLQEIGNRIEASKKQGKMTGQELYNNTFQNQMKQNEKKSWELEPDEKARIQKETAQIAQEHREQEEQQKQVPIQQEEYQNAQNIAQPVQQQIPPQQPPIDMGSMGL